MSHLLWGGVERGGDTMQGLNVLATIVYKIAKVNETIDGKLDAYVAPCQQV